MDTNKLKRFATEARNILKAGISAKITTLGFDRKGNVPEHLFPQLMQGGTLWNGTLQTESFYHQWMSMYKRVQEKGINEVFEEAAYTWFNRLCAIRILQKNGLCGPVFDYADMARTPQIVDEARQGHFPNMPEETRARLMELLDDDTKVTEQFALLISAWCHENPIINKCFGGMADYTEILLPNNILAEGGFVDMLNHTEFITDENYQSPELIGWLYQFYISERKDEVFAKKGKFEADEIPAATQIFTPNWIVKYMVQNTVGRIYLDNNPHENQIQKKWKYLVEPSEKTPADSILKYEELTDLKVGDLACGSGHILNECFDLLYDLYVYEGYGRAETIENIFIHNLTGIDLDTRAKQLATFALLLKACQKDASFADAHCMPNLLSMPIPFEQNRLEWDENTDEEFIEFVHLFFQGEDNHKILDELALCFIEIQKASILGSIMNFYISDSTRLLVKQFTDFWCNQAIVPNLISTQIPAFKLILALTEKYHALVMNPPYMGSSRFDNILSEYVKKNYPSSKADLFSVFMDVAIGHLVPNGKYGMINMHSWMFLSSFEELRCNLLDTQSIDSLLHLGPRTFDELSGEVVQNAAFVISNSHEGRFVSSSTEHLQHCVETKKGTYFRLVDGKNCSDKEHMFLEALHKQTEKVYYGGVMQYNFKMIPGNVWGYWLTTAWLSLLRGFKIKECVTPKAGIVTGSDPYFVRDWYEVSYNEINKGPAPHNKYSKYHLFHKGGSPRKYYGDGEYVLKLNDFWNPDYYNVSIRRGDSDYYFKKGVGWSQIGSSSFKTFRCIENCVCGTATPTIYPTDKSNYYFLLGLLNTPIAKVLLDLYNPTMNLLSTNICDIPFVDVGANKLIINELVKNNIALSRQDWDAHETSWDFQTNELIRLSSEGFGFVVVNNVKDVSCFSIDLLIDNYKTYWEEKFFTLHRNEEELNSQFINLYGLQDELSPFVPLNEITILQQGEISINPKEEFDENGYPVNQLIWHDDIIIKQLISYAVGCMLGRYRIDKPGLHIAHQEPTEEEIAPYKYKGFTYEIDDDGIMPFMTNDSGFSDNAALRFSEFIRTAFGEMGQVENLNFIEQCLGKSVEQYFVKDFWKDHKKMYQNRPIYWLFSSKKGAFQVIAYMHRMNPYTVERIRAKYLLPYIENLQTKIADMDSRRASLSTRETKQLQLLEKTLDECKEYHDRLQVVAEQAIGFDLDDGVVVNYAKFGDVLAKIK